MRVRKTSDALRSADIYHAFSHASLKRETWSITDLFKYYNPPQIKLLYKFIGHILIQHHCHQLFNCLTKTNKYEEKNVTIITA